MIVTKNSGTQYQNLNKQIIKFHIENKWIIAFIERPLSYNKILKKPHYKDFPTGEYFQEYIDDITQEEIQAGTDKVKEYCKINNCIELYYDYLLAISKNDNEKLVALKEKKKYEINQKCKEIISSGFEFEGNMYQSDENSQKDIANTASTNRTNIKWITIDNQIIDFTNEKFKEFHSVLNNFIQDNVIKARMLKNELNLAKTIKKIESIKW